jgi:hypothetical protein
MIALSALESATPLRSGILALGGEQEVSSSAGPRQDWRQEVWQREFRFASTRGEVALSSGALELRFARLMPDDIVNLRAVSAGEFGVARYAFGFLRYARPEHRVRVEQVAGLDPKAIAAETGRLSIERAADPRIRVFADIEVPTGTWVKLVADGRLIFHGRLFKGVCFGNGALWPPHARLRHVIAHAMLRHYVDALGAFVNAEEVMAGLDRSTERAISWSRDGSDASWVALEVRIGSDGRVLSVEPLIGSPEIVDDVAHRIAERSFHVSRLSRAGKVIRTAVIGRLEGGDVLFTSPTLR